MYHKAGDSWSFIRGEPQMSACDFGKVDQLTGIVNDVLAGKEVTVPTTPPASKPDFEKRSEDVFDALNASRVPAKK